MMLAAAAAALFAGWSLNAGAASHPYAAHALTVYWGLPVLSILLLITAFGLFARKRWAHFPALAACFVAPALVVIALIALVGGGWLIAVLVLWGWGEQAGLARRNPDAVYAAAVIAAIVVPLALYFSRRLFRHLRSPAGLAEFGYGPGVGASMGVHPGGVVIVVLALWAALKSLSPLVIPAGSLPSLLRTDAMQGQVTAANERSDALLATGAMISDDERSILLAGSFQRFFYLWDLVSGRLEKKPADQLPAFPPWASFAPDAKHFVSRDGELVSIATGKKTRLASMPSLGKRLGFAGKERFLLYTGGWPYDPTSITVKLVDLAADRVVYEKAMPGNFSEGNAQPVDGAWSPDRSVYAWHDSRAQMLHILRVASGEIEQFPCECRASHLVTFSRDGDLLYIAGSGSRSGTARFPAGVVFSIQEKTFAPGLPFGPILYASSREDRVVLWGQDDPPTVAEYPARHFDAPRWRVATEGAQAAMTADGRKLVLVGRNVPSKVRLAEMANEPSQNPPVFRTIESTIGSGTGVTLSARNGIVLFVGSPIAEVLRFDKPGGALSAIDVRKAKN